MPFRLKRSACVVIGTFNIYIVQPRWLARMGIIPKGVPVTITTKMDEPGFRFTSSKIPCAWLVTPGRIEVSTEDPTVDCGEAASKVLKNLPWTPVTAIGHNSIYTAAVTELELLQCFQGVYPQPEGYECVRRTVHFGLKQGDQVFNVQAAVTPEEIELATNSHTDLGERDNEFAHQTAAQFLEHRRKAECLARDLFKVSIEHGNQNSPPE